MTATKHLKFLFYLSLTISLSLSSCHSKPSNDSQADTESNLNKYVDTDKVTTFYFHANRRCATCEAVETVSKATLKEHFGSDIEFIAINRDKKENANIVDHYKVNAQTLLIVKGKQTINLTNDAFLYARTNPDKLKSKIKEAIDALL